jgi:hypothetical protein
MEGSATVDEGETIVSRDPDTGQEIEVETGFGWNPQTSQIQKYEEVWR